MKINYEIYRDDILAVDSAATEEEIQASYKFMSEMLPFFVSIYEQGKAGKPLEDLLFWMEVDNEH